jgi:two-component system OmpR family response regulator
MDGSQHILVVVDDDEELRALLSIFLARSGYRVSVAQNGAVMQTLEMARVDLVILDIMLPGEDGLSLCRRLRAAGTMPIIMLTALGTETDRVVGLDMGADDYLPKLFSTRELRARIRAVLRRST